MGSPFSCSGVFDEGTEAMSNSMPHCKWYGRDWLGDPLLRMVGPAEKGIWADLLNAMMCSERYGYLTVRGKPMRDEEAAKICGTSVETYKPLLARLEEVGIPSRADDGTLYSRRLVRDYEAYKVASESGRRGGGNPLLRKKPEARSQKPQYLWRIPIKAPIKATRNQRIPFLVRDMSRTTPDSLLLHLHLLLSLILQRGSLRGGLRWSARKAPTSRHTENWAR